jgi:hypothetical protein
MKIKSLDMRIFTTLDLTSDRVIYYENSSFFWTLSGVMKLSPSMGFRFQAGSRVFTPDT